MIYVPLLFLRLLLPLRVQLVYLDRGICRVVGGCNQLASVKVGSATEPLAAGCSVVTGQVLPRCPQL